MFSLDRADHAIDAAFCPKSIVEITSVRCGHPLRIRPCCQIRYGSHAVLTFPLHRAKVTLPYIGIKYATLLVFAKFTKYVKHRSWICMYPSLEFAVSIKSNFVSSDLLPASFRHRTFHFFSSSSTTSIFVDVTVRLVVLIQ